MKFSDFGGPQDVGATGHCTDLPYHSYAIATHYKMYKILFLVIKYDLRRIVYATCAKRVFVADDMLFSSTSPR